VLSADRIGVTVAAIHINVVPFYVVILMLWFGGSLILTQIAGAILVAVGVILAQITTRLNRLAPQ
jgi:drug/metabolite transporter (DMT)-like permease